MMSYTTRRKRDPFEAKRAQGGNQLAFQGGRDGKDREYISIGSPESRERQRGGNNGAEKLIKRKGILWKEDADKRKDLKITLSEESNGNSPRYLRCAT